MKTFSSREDKGALDRPARVRVVFKAGAGTHGLGNGKVVVIHPPRTQIFGQQRSGEFLAKVTLNSDIRRSGEVFADCRAEQQIADRVSSNEGSVPPRTSHSKFQTRP